MSDWIETTLGEVVDLVRGYSFPIKHQGGAEGTPFFKVSDMNTPGNEVWLSAAANRVTDKVLSETKARVHPTGTVVFARVGAALATEKRRLLAQPSAVDDNVMGLIARPGVLPEYLYNFMLTIRLGAFAQSGAVPSVNQSHLRRIKLDLPPLPVQERIVEVTGAVDEQVAALEVEADALDALLRGLKERLFAHYAATAATLPIGQVLEEAKRPITVDPESEYRQIGIRSHGRGLFTKEAVAGQSLGSKKVFWVEPGDLVINIVFAWEGAVAIVPPDIEGYCGSHRFPAYRRLDGGDIEFFRLFFSTKTGTQLLASCSPGGAGRNRTLNRKRLMQSPIGMPPPGEQDRAICMLQALEATVVATRAETDRLRAVRAALLSGVLDRKIELADAEREA